MRSHKPSLQEELFDKAASILSPIERAEFLERACGGDLVLRTRLDRLLEAHYGADGFLSDPPSPVQMECGDALPRLDRFTLNEKIGEGGFGEVWSAEQQEPVRREVAVKLLKRGMDSHQVIARFEAERQALAMMNHPNIARIFDAGTTADGRSYFVMERVHGKKITAYCDEHALSVRERLELFVRVCEAIQHAHQKGIIHRDIKPSNILVTHQDGVAVPKVIDFGIAKALDQPLTDQTVLTHFQQFLGTPAYISPEQALISSGDIDTRSDIYSLGVLLYELLTGAPPFENDDLLAVGLDQMRRIIRERDPGSPVRAAWICVAIEAGRLGEKHAVGQAQDGRKRSILIWIGL